MFSDKLISLLQAFSKYELNRFRKFLDSPYYNEREDIIHLFDLINKVLRENDESSLQGLTKEKVWKKVYPKREPDYAALRRLASDLTKLAYRFMAIEQMDLDELSQGIYLQRAMTKQAFAKHAAGVERDIEQRLELVRGKSTGFFLLKYLYYNNIFNREHQTIGSKNYIEKLLPANRELDLFYVSQKLKYYNAWLHFSGVHSTLEKVSLPQGMLEYIEREKIGDEPVILVYRLVIECFSDRENENHFYKLLDVLEKYADILARDDLRECYLIAQNYCAIKINQGKLDYYREVFLIYKKIIENDLLLENGQVSEGVYKNIITASLRTGEDVWAEDFIEHYSKYLPAGVRENARTFSLANLYSYQKRHEKVIELLRDVEFSGPVYAFGTKMILLRTYYDTKEYLAIDSLMFSFRIFVMRNKFISNSVKREYTNFLNFLKKLTLIPFTEKRDLVKLRRKIEETKSVASKKWLLEKIDELENRGQRTGNQSPFDKKR